MEIAKHLLASFNPENVNLVSNPNVDPQKSLNYTSLSNLISNLTNNKGLDRFRYLIFAIKEALHI